MNDDNCEYTKCVVAHRDINMDSRIVSFEVKDIR